MKKIFKISDEQIKNMYLSGSSMTDIAKLAQDTKGVMALRAKLHELGVDTTRNMKKYSSKISISGKKYSFNEYYFDNIDCQEKAYWLGFFAADGYNNVSKGCIEFRLHMQDKDILEKFKSCIGANNPIKLYKQRYINLSLYSKHLCAKLSEYGLIQAKTYNLQLPNLENHLMRHFIRGYFDGDGCFSVIKRNNRKNPNSKIYQFNITGMLEPLKKIQEHLVNNVGVVDNGLKHRKSTTAVTIHYGGRNVCKRILDYLYEDAAIYLQRKYNKYKEYCISVE